MTQQTLDLRHISKRFGKTEVLKDIDLSVRPGEFLSLVGSSGCGKSTLLRIIAGLETPDSGTVAIGSEDVTDIDPSDRNLAMVFQSYALYPHMSVRQNIATPLRMRRLPLAARLPLVGRAIASREVVSQIEADVTAAAQTLQIDHLLDRKPAALSGGQRQRVALARALVRSPAAFLMDEPLSNLDAKLRAHMREELSALHRRLGATFVYVTHDQIEAMTMSDRVALMCEGRIEQLGTPDDLYQRPASLTVARFIGTPAINLVPAEISASGRVSALGLEPGVHTTPDHAGAATLGLRPEDLHVAADGWRARVDRSENHGGDRILRCQLVDHPGLSLTLRQSSSSPLPGGTDGVFHLAIAPERAHVFGADEMRCSTTCREQVAA